MPCGSFSMRLTTLVIVGRPNVGKSTLFNRLVGRRAAIVMAEPGVTRDRHYGRGEWEGRPFLGVDTGGIAAEGSDLFNPLILEQTRLAVEEADVVLFLVDGLEGLMPADFSIAQMLRAAGKPFLLVVNKGDAAEARDTYWDFFRLGLAEPRLISAEHGHNVAELIRDALELVPEEQGEEGSVQTGEIRVAVVGRPNVGKSSFINRLIGEERSLVSPVPGTTRDPVDSLHTHGGRLYRFVDTSGIRRRGKVGDRKVEAVSMILAFRSIERAQVVLLIVDGSSGPRVMDAQIARHIVESGRACGILLNKWDLVEKDSKTFDQTVKGIREKLVHVDFAPIVSVSALTGQRCSHVFELIEKVFASHRRRVPTRELNLAVREWVKAHPPTLRSGTRRPKIYYATQTSVAPPQIILFSSSIPEPSYARYIENRARETFGFEGTPIRITFRQRRGKSGRGRRSLSKR